ncbi:MAG: hypothetical protein ABIF10_05295 [Candidatus Woesearchaeota archaeon]
MDDIRKTLEFAHIPGIDIFQISFLTALPGTDLWDKCEAKGLVTKYMDWTRLNLDLRESELGKKVFLGDMCSVEEVWNLIKKDFYREQVGKLSAARVMSPSRIVVFLKYFFSNPKKYYLLSVLTVKSKLSMFFLQKVAFN